MKVITHITTVIQTADDNRPLSVTTATVHEDGDNPTYFPKVVAQAQAVASDRHLDAALGAIKGMHK